MQTKPRKTHQTICKSCHHSRSRKWAKENPERSKEIWRKYRISNPDSVKKTLIKYNTTHPTARLDAVLRWRNNHPEQFKGMVRKTNARRLNTVKGKLNNSMSGRIRYSLKYGSKNGRHWESLVGYTVYELKKHLESKFDYNMSWDNYGTYWEIDHIIPICVFNYESPEDIDFKRCWSLDNLQPLEARENVRKHARIESPFQPALAMAI